MDEITFTNIRSKLPVIDDGANKEGKRYVLVRHKKPRLVVMGLDDYEKLVSQAGTPQSVVEVVETFEGDTNDEINLRPPAAALPFK